jgi:MFS family permease
MATMFVRGSHSLYSIRLLLGITEAGFFPGVILYLTYWFPARIRGQIMGLFYLGVPLALVIGSPLSGFLLSMHPVAGLENWQWMFAVEGFFAVAVGAASYWFLDNRPSEAKWLSADEREALTAALVREENERRAHGPTRLLTAVRDPRVMHFVLIYFLIQMSVYGTVFYLPTEVSAIMHRPAGIEVGLVSAIPWCCAVVAAYRLPRWADDKRNHRAMAAWLLAIAGAASLLFPLVGPVASLTALSIAASGFIAVQPIFWTFPTGYLADRAAAGGIALISLGNLGGMFAPVLKVWADNRFHSTKAGLFVLAGLTIANAVLVSLIRAHRHASSADRAQSSIGSPT